MLNKIELHRTKLYDLNEEEVRTIRNAFLITEREEHKLKSKL